MANMRFGGFVALLACSALAYANWLALNEEVEITPLRSGLETEAPPLAQPAAHRVRAALDDLAETVERPLFSPSRRPAAPASQEPAIAETATVPPSPDFVQQAANLPEVRLLGTLHDGAAKSRALLQVQDAVAAGWVDVGSDIAGWRLSAVQKDHVVLEATNERKTISLYTLQRTAE